MTRPLLVAVSALGLIAWLAIPAAAQPRYVPPPGRIELTVGVQLSGDSKLGSREANLTTSTGGALRLFNTATKLTASPGVEGRVGFHLTGRLDVEAFGSFARPALETAISADIENAPAIAAEETTKQYVVGGAALWNLRTRFSSPRLQPFVMGSAAYLRQLHDSDTLAVNGQMFEAGGGVKYMLTSRPAVPRSKTKLHAVGVRADVRLQIRRRGAATDNAVHYGPAAAAALFLRF